MRHRSFLLDTYCSTALRAVHDAFYPKNRTQFGTTAVSHVLLLMLILAGGCSQPEDPFTAQEGGVRISLSTNQVLIGDVFQAAVEVTHPSSSIVTMPSVDGNDELSVLNRTVETRSVSEDESVTRFDYSLQGFSVGVYDLATNGVALRMEDQTETLSLPDLPIEIISSLVSEEEPLAGLKDPILWKTVSQNRLLLAIAAVALLALAAGMIALLIRRSRKPKASPPPPVIPAHELAFKALRDLKASSLLQDGEFEQYYVTLSDIVRHYLENRFDLHAPEQTTEEFIRETSTHAALNEEQKLRVQAFLEQSDLVKFAKFMPTAAEADAAYDSAIQLVEETQERVGGASSDLPSDAQESAPPHHPSDGTGGKS